MVNYDDLEDDEKRNSLTPRIINMSQYYNPNRTRNLYDKSSKDIFRLSRGKIDNFIACPRCFYLDRKLGVAQPPGYPISLNSAVDKLLKKEFDIHRAEGSSHPLMKAYGIDAVPLSHEKMDEWRDSLRAGITFKIDGENVVITVSYPIGSKEVGSVEEVDKIEAFKEAGYKLFATIEIE